MSENFAYDFVVVGGGSAGYAAARTAAGSGLKVAVVEGGGEVGGLCILRGCMPSKALIESANRMLAAREALVFGLQFSEVRADVPAIVNRKRALIENFAGYRRQQLEAGPFDFFRGHARFLGPDRIAVQLMDGGSLEIESSYFLIATGSKIFSPDVPGLMEVNSLTSNDILDATELPHSVAVLGAGPVALELAHYMHAVGVKVTIIQRSKHFLRGVDPDLAATVESTFRERGIEIHTGTKLLKVESSGDGIRIHFEEDGKVCDVGAVAVFNGLGRVPNVDGLDLEKAGVELKGGGIGVTPTQQTSNPNIFAAGDCCGPYEVVHIAIQQGELAARNAANIFKNGSAQETMDYRLKLFAVFTQPQIGVVGLSETEARERGIPYKVATYPFNDHGKSMVMGANDGFVKLLADPTSGELLGGAVVGPHASDLIHEVVVAMAFHSTAAQFAAIPHYHPTLSEIWTYPAEELAG
jgi:pyruvate/2-oxoglutarate dehydrogenase complex dihydrolipoamide dehydrogenase (E3) component